MLSIVYWGPLKLQPEDGFMKAETCCWYVLLINCILCNKVVLAVKLYSSVKNKPHVKMIEIWASEARVGLLRLFSPTRFNVRPDDGLTFNPEDVAVKTVFINNEVTLH